LKNNPTALILWALVALAAFSPAAIEAKIFPYDVHTEVLENGLQVNLVPMKSDGLVTVWSIVRTGSRDEYEPGRTGFAHFFEHMMFRGTERFPAEVYNATMTSMGADTNAFTTDDLTAYYLNITSEDLAKVLDLEADRFQNLSYPEESFRTEAGAVYGEFRKNRTNPFFVINEALSEAAFKAHTYGHTTMGYEKDIKGMPELYGYSKEFFSRYYRPENVVLLIVGDFDTAATMQTIRQHYGGWKPGYVAPNIPTEPEQTAEERISVSYDGNTLPIIWLGYKAPAFDPTDRIQMAARLLCDLAFGQTSEVYQELVLKEQTMEFLGASYDMTRDTKLLDIFGRVKDPEKVDEVLTRIDQVVSKFQATPPDAQKLADLKSNQKYGFLMNLDTPAKVSRQLVRGIAVTGGIEALEQYYETLNAVTPEDIQQAAKDYLARDRRTVAVLRGNN
jgi:zinc protease